MVQSVLAPPSEVTSPTAVSWWVPGYARMCALDSSSRIRLAGLPAPTSWEARTTDFPGVVHLRRLPAAAPDCLTLDTAGRLRLPKRVRQWLTPGVHRDKVATAVSTGAATGAAGGGPVRQVVVVSDPPYETIALGASWILGPLLVLPARGHGDVGLVLAT